MDAVIFDAERVAGVHIPAVEEDAHAGVEVLHLAVEVLLDGAVGRGSELRLHAGSAGDVLLEDGLVLFPISAEIPFHKFQQPLFADLGNSVVARAGQLLLDAAI